MKVKILGQGGFGLVVKKRDRTDGLIAVKVLPIRKDEDEGVFINEAKLGMLLDHSNLMKCYGYSITDLVDDLGVKRAVLKQFPNETFTRFLVQRTEYCNGGSVQDWIVAVKNRNRSQESAENLFSQILKAAVFLRKSGIVHGDLKPQNIFLYNSNGETVIKVGDFGEAFYFKGPRKTHAPTRLYQEKDELISRMITDNREDRPDIYTVQNIFEGITRKHPNFSKSCPVPGQNPLYQGRVEIHQEIQNLIINPTPMLPKYVLLHGIAGSGKKSIPTQLIHSKFESEEFNRFIWFPSDTRNKLNIKYQEFMKEHHRKGQKSSAKTAKNWLETNPGWIVVYENVNSINEIKDLIPTKGPGLVICTTRIDSEDYPDYFHKIRVDPLPLKDCVQLINGHYCLTKKPDDSQPYFPSTDEATNLSLLMSCLPVAIVQSLAFIKSRNNNGIETVEKYIEFHNQNMKEWDNKIVRFSKTNFGPIYKSLKLVVDQIRKRNTTAFDWLKICAYLDHENIPEILFLSFLQSNQTDPNASKDVLNILKSFDVITFIQDQNGNSYFTITRIVQEVIRMLNHRRFENTVTEIQNLFLESVPATKNKKLKKLGVELLIQNLTSHYESVVGHINNYMQSSAPSPSVSPISCIKSQKEFDFQKSILEIKFRFLKRLRNCYKSLMFRKQEQKTNEDLLEIKELLYGKDNLKLGTTLMAIGKMKFSSAIEQGGIKSKRFAENIEEAISQFKEAAEVLESCYKENIYTGRYDVYQCYLYLGDCYKLLIKQNIRSRGQSTENETELKKNATTAMDYYQKALELVFLVVLSKNLALLDVIGFTLRKIAEIYEHFRSLDNVVIIEKYLIIALEFYLLHSDDLKARHKESTSKDLKNDLPWAASRSKNEIELSRILKKVSEKECILKNLDNFKVTDKLVEVTLNEWKKNANGTSAILKALLRCYKMSKELHIIKIKAKSRDKMAEPKNSEILKRLASKMELAEKIRNLCKLEDTALNYVQSNNKVLKVGLQMETDTISSVLKSKVGDLEIAENNILLAKSLKREFKTDAALEHFNTALQIFLQRKNKHPRSMSMAALYENIAACHTILKNTGLACDYYKKSYELQKSDKVLVKKINIGLARLMQKYSKVLPREEIDEKIRLLEETLPILTSYYEVKPELPGHNEIGFVREKIGALLIDAGRKLEPETEAHLLEALRIFNANLKVGNQNIITCLEKLILVNAIYPSKRMKYEEELKTHQNHARKVEEPTENGQLPSVDQESKTNSAKWMRMKRRQNKSKIQREYGKPLRSSDN